MSFGGGTGGAGVSPFGQQQQNAFGSPATTNANPFGGGGTSGFGSSIGGASNAFGGSSFGGNAQQRPVSGGFGATSSPAFGSGGFGGGSQSFGGSASAQPSAFGGGGFGSTTTTPSAFGGSPAGGFGSTTGFGNTAAPSAFGGAAGGVGGFGSQQQNQGAAEGTRGVNYQVTQETDSLGSGYGGQTGKYVTITAMPAYRQKSVEELRFEDYKQGVKGKVGGVGGAGAFGGGGAFGSAASQSSFGPSSASPFGSSGGAGGFGAPSSGFGSSVSPTGGAGAFGGGGAAFGAAQGAPGAFGAASSPSGFGGAGGFGMQQASASAFGAASSSAFGGAFGSTAGGGGGFGQMGQSASAFGAASSSPAFGAGGFGASTGGAFGAPASASAFGGAQSSPAFGGAFGAAGGAGASAPGFGLAGSAPSFGAFGGSMPASAPGFGGFSSASALGATAAPGMFGAASAGASTFGSTFSTQQQPALGGMSAPGFGASGGMFGAPAASGGMFGAQASAPAFGAFGAAPGASAPTAGLFGNLGAAKPIMPAASFGSQPVMGALGAAPTLGGLGGSTPSFSFAGAGAPAAPGTSLFAASASTLGGMATTPVLGGAAAGAPSLFGASGATPLQAGAQPGQAGTPYGQLPQLPAPTATLTPGNPQTPQSADAANGKRSVGTGIASASRTAHTMLSPRLITPRSAMRMRPRRSPQSQSATPLGGPNLSQGGLMASPQQKVGATGGRIQSSPRPAAPIEDTVIVARENPRKLFVRDAVVSPFSAGGSSLHSMASPGGSAGAQQPPSGGRGLGPAKTVVASRTKIGSHHVNGGGGRITSASPLNGSASKELNFLSPESAYGVAARSPATPIMLSDVSAERRTLLLPSMQSREYYSEPSVDDLARWAKSDPSYLEAVPNLLVGRKGYGELRFKEPVDLRSVVIDRIVQFGDKEIRVYMDSEAPKPPPGEGLNKPAEITLFNVHKVDKATNGVVRDPRKVEAFAKKLETRARAQGATFVSYKQEVTSRNPKGGEYTFAVQHFSKYDGFVEDSSDDEEWEDIGRGKVGDGGGVFSDGRNLAQAMAIDSGLDPSEIVAMQSEIPVIEVGRGLAGRARAAAAERERVRHSWQRAPVSPSPILGSRRSPIKERARGGARSTDLAAREAPLNYCQVDSLPIDRTCLAGRTDLATDAAAILGRSFRVGWGPGGRFAHSGFWTASRGQNKQKASSIHVERIVPLGKRGAGGSILGATSGAAATHKRAHDACVKYLEVHMSMGGSGEGGQVNKEAMACHFLCPRGPASPPSAELGRRSLAVTEETMEEVCEAHADAVASLDTGAGDDVGRAHILGIWRLVARVFGRIQSAASRAEAHAGAEDDDYNIIRRQKISDWLRDHAQWAVARASAAAGADDADDLDEVLARLSKHDIRGATEAALAAKDTRMASLIAMAGCHAHLKEDLRQQLEIWEARDMNDHIDEQRRLVYQVLSGTVEGALGFHGFDWRRALALIMWYHRSAIEPVEASIHSYLKFEQDSVIGPPLPMHLEFGKAWGGSETSARGLDTAFEVLRFLDARNGPQLAGVFGPAGHTTDALDYSLPWHLLSLLEGLEILDFSSATPADQEIMLQVHFGYLLQLDFLGVSPEWVLYVALHLPNPLGRPHLREDVVCELLSRTVGQWIGDESRTEFFAETLGIPSRWIAGAEALWHRHAHDRQNEFDACLRAGAIAEAYQIFSSVLGPEAFAKECGAIGHAFASADCADLRAKIEVLQRRRAGLHKDQQHELDLYSRFLGVLDDHRAGSGGAGGSSGGGTSFGDFFRHFSGNLTPRADGKGEPSPFWAVAQKMAAIYSETLRHSTCRGSEGGARLARNQIRAAALSNIAPEQALTHIQDAAAVISNLL